MSPRALIETLGGRGFALAVVDGNLVVRPAARLTAEDRGAIRVHLPGLVAALSSDEVVSAEWDEAAARQLMSDADGLVSELGVSGLGPAVQAAAEVVVRAHLAEDMKELRVAVLEFVAVVRGLTPRAAPPAPG